MERVWEELKKIEAEAEQIRTDSQNQAKKIITQSQLDAEKLIANSTAYGTEEANRLYATAVEEANGNRNEQLKINQTATQKLKAQAEKQMNEAISKIVDSVVEEAKP